MTPEAKELVERAGYMVGNPSAWDCFDQQASDLIASLRATITQQDARIAELERGRDAALEAEDAAKDCFWAIYPDWVKANGHGISTEAARTVLAERVAELEAALTPSADTKAAYMGEFYMGVTLRAGGEEEIRRVQIPWDSIKEIMAAIRARSVLGGKNGR